MSLNERDLANLANAPSSAKTQYTYEQIKKAIQENSRIRTKNYRVYLQGSYANRTNIKAESDVDVVVELLSTFSHDLSRLTGAEKEIFHTVYPNSATYTWSDFRSDIVQALKGYFGADFVDESGKKSIKLKADNLRVNADIIPCLEHRDYNSFSHSRYTDFVPGIKFWTIPDRRKIINFPKPHIENGQNKNSKERTDEAYKSIVRVSKNIKWKLVEEGYLDPKTVPSYFIECSIYNVPDSYFSNSLKNSLENAMMHLLTEANTDTMLTVSHQHLLFGSESWQWNVSDAADFFTKAHRYQS